MASYRDNRHNGPDERVLVTTSDGTVSNSRAYVYDQDHRLIGEYGSSITDPIAETIWLQPEVANDNQPIGGDDGVGGYAPLAMATGSGGSSTFYWLHGNHLGVPQVITDASGAAATPTGHTLPGYPGQLRTLADLYYNRHRDYDSSTGRYIQADPIGLEGGDNPYLYAEGNPLTYVDPTGEFGIVGAAIGGGIDLGFQLVANGGKIRCVNWTQVGISTALGAVGGGAWGGAFKLKSGSNAWRATRAWLGKNGFAKSGQHAHHWLLEQNSKIGKWIPDSIKNQPWNLNPMSAEVHRALHSRDTITRTIAGAPGWANGAVIGLGITAGGDGCGCQ